MRVAILTSSRADYGIYLPLLRKLVAEDFFEMKILAFGTHLSHFHGYTIDKIKADGFDVEEGLETLVLGDSEEAVSTAIGLSTLKFSAIWSKMKDNLDLIIALGDRYEMFAAVSASVPFNIPVAHIHGGETTLGAIDNKFRHAITLMSNLHFTSTKAYAEKVESMVGDSQGIHCVGALSLDNLRDINLLTKVEFFEKFKIDLTLSSILITVHPETVSAEKNIAHLVVLSKVFDYLTKDFQLIITMPNADTLGTVIRNRFAELASKNQRILCVENFGTLGYFSCMKHCSFLLGNTSSGIIEAASFGKYVVNLGNRQKGRKSGENVFNVPIVEKKILETVRRLAKLGDYQGENIYQPSSSAASEIIRILKKVKF